MPLKIHLRKDQKIIINGAVIENASAHNTSLLVKNDAAILRDTDIMTLEGADTPAKMVYYALQCAYLFPHKEEEHLQRLTNFLDDYVQAAPSAGKIREEISECVSKGELYGGLRKARDLMAHERDLLADVQEESQQKL